jgi:hypothetical protein
MVWIGYNMDWITDSIDCIQTVYGMAASSTPICLRLMESWEGSYKIQCGIMERMVMATRVPVPHFSVMVLVAVLVLVPHFSVLVLVPHQTVRLSRITVLVPVPHFSVSVLVPH